MSSNVLSKSPLASDARFLELNRTLESLGNQAAELEAQSPEAAQVLRQYVELGREKILEAAGKRWESSVSSQVPATELVAKPAGGFGSAEALIRKRLDVSQNAAQSPAEKTQQLKTGLIVHLAKAEGVQPQALAAPQTLMEYQALVRAAEQLGIETNSLMDLARGSVTNPPRRASDLDELCWSAGIEKEALFKPLTVEERIGVRQVAAKRGGCAERLVKEMRESKTWKELSSTDPRKMQPEYFEPAWVEMNHAQASGSYSFYSDDFEDYRRQRNSLSARDLLGRRVMVGVENEKGALVELVKGVCTRVDPQATAMFTVKTESGEMREFNINQIHHMAVR